MKRFLIKTILVCIPAILVVVLPEVIKTKGDLSQLGQIGFNKWYRRNIQVSNATDYKTSYYESVNDYLKSEKCDILMIGDSFAHKKIQDDLSYCLNKSINTIFHNLDIAPCSIFITLMSKRKNTIPQVVIIESVERYFVNRLSNIQFDSLLELDSIYYESKTKNYIEKAQDFYKKKLGMFDDWEDPVKNVKLTKDLFSCKDKERDLYFYHEDLFECSDSEINDALGKLKLLHDYAMSQGIYMIYMVAADKYDVYQKYIVDNPYKPNDILSKGNRFDSLPYFINTKYVLTEAAENDIKDIYWADDSHWSPIGAKIVAEEIARRVDSLELF